MTKNYKTSNGHHARTALITGGTRRIGAAIARAFAQQGWQIVLHARQREAQAEAFRDELQAECGRRVWLIHGNLAESGAPEKIFYEAIAHAGQLEALVNNAGIFELQSMASANAADFERHWRVNALAPIALTQLLARHLAERRSQGAVVNLLDQRIVRPSATATPYWISKKALAAYTKSAALGFAPYLRVNAIAPGALLLPAAPDASEPAGDFPLALRPNLTALTEAVNFLLNASAITGQILFLDGGQHLL